MIRKFVGLIVALFSLAGLMMLTAGQVHSQGGFKNFAWLQPSTPGVSQSGHVNVSGIVRAGKIGVGINPSAMIDVEGPVPTAINARTTHSSGVSVYGETTGGLGAGVIGAASANSGTPIGVYGLSSSAEDGVGIFGIAQLSAGRNFGVRGHTNSGFGYGIYGINVANIGDGNGVAGVTANGSAGVYGTGPVIGIEGYASTTSTNLSVAGKFTTGNSNSSTVYATAGHPSGDTVAGTFVNLSTDGTGIHSLVPATVGPTVGIYSEIRSQSGTGIHSKVNTLGNGNYGVLAECPAPGWALFAVSNFGATGTKSFVIDHPLDPENKTLKHYCNESPQPMNSYSGSVRTDSRGYAWVELPDYFEAINKNSRIQLTIVDEKNSDQFVLAKVTRKVENGKFQIRTNLPNVEVFWRVEAERNDRYVQAYGAPVESVKTELQKGKYYHPELYGAKPEMGITYKPSKDVQLDVAQPKKLPTSYLPKLRQPR